MCPPIEESPPLVRGLSVGGHIGRGLLCGGSPQPFDVAPTFGYSKRRADTVQLEQNPEVAFANLEVQRFESIVERVMPKGRRGGIVTDYLK